VLTHDAPAPSRLRPELGIPGAVEAVVMRAMEKNRDRRYQEMADLERDLERLLAGDQNVGLAAAPSEGVLPPSALETGPSRWHLAAAAVIALAAGLAFALSRSPTEQQSQKAAESVGAPAGTAPLTAAPPPASPTRPAATVVAPPQQAASAAVAAPGKPGRLAPLRRGPRPDHRPADTAARSAGDRTQPSESAKRGVLPLRSPEAYPDQ
jgi:serine/threonine-protein kinase